MNNIEIGKRIKQTREEKSMSLQAVAEITGVARSTVQRYEVGRIDKLKLPVIESIARALGVRPDWIIGKTVATEQVRLLTLDEKYTKPDNIVPIAEESVPDHLAVQAAYNDSIIDDEELNKMQRDIELLKKYHK